MNLGALTDHEGPRQSLNLLSVKHTSNKGRLRKDLAGRNGMANDEPTSLRMGFGFPQARAAGAPYVPSRPGWRM